MRVAVVAAVMGLVWAFAGCALGIDAGFELNVPSPTARRIYDGPLTGIVPVHRHGVRCGHANVWFDGHETYREPEGWVFFSPSRGAWMRYDEPPAALVAAE